MKDIFGIYKILMDMATCVIFHDNKFFCKQLDYVIRRSLSAYDIPLRSFDLNLENLTDGIIQEGEKLSDEELFALYEMVSDNFSPTVADRRLKVVRDGDTYIEKPKIQFKDLQYKAELLNVSEETIYIDGIVFCEIKQRIFHTVNKMENFVMGEDIYSVGTNYYDKLEKIFELLPRSDLEYMKESFQSLPSSDEEVSQHRADSIKIASKLFQKRYDNEFPQTAIEKEKQGESYVL